MDHQRAGRLQSAPMHAARDGKVPSWVTPTVFVRRDPAPIAVFLLTADSCAACGDGGREVVPAPHVTSLPASLMLALCNSCCSFY